MSVIVVMIVSMIVIVLVFGVCCMAVVGVVTRVFGR